uniref:hypothetical protein n=1 Tax=Rhodanobacter glycinis TaxID=582702 RepID=UPI00155A084A|nr:hypothetical protein [Rhodanobacter glycinis]
MTSARPERLIIGVFLDINIFTARLLHEESSLHDGHLLDVVIPAKAEMAIFFSGRLK